MHGLERPGKNKLEARGIQVIVNRATSKEATATAIARALITPLATTGGPQRKGGRCRASPAWKAHPQRLGREESARSKVCNTKGFPGASEPYTYTISNQNMYSYYSAKNL